MLQGQLGSENYQYFRLLIKGCDEKKQTDCKTVEEQKDFWSKGRFFVYLFKFGEENFRSKERLPDSV